MNISAITVTKYKIQELFAKILKNQNYQKQQPFVFQNIKQILHNCEKNSTKLIHAFQKFEQHLHLRMLSDAISLSTHCFLIYKQKNWKIMLEVKMIFISEFFVLHCQLNEHSAMIHCDSYVQSALQQNMACIWMKKLMLHYVIKSLLNACVQFHVIAFKANQLKHFKLLHGTRAHFSYTILYYTKKYSRGHSGLNKMIFQISEKHLLL